MIKVVQEFRERISAEADEFIESFGQDAYAEVKREIRRACERGDIRRETFLACVAQEVAKRTNIELVSNFANRGHQAPYDSGPGLMRKRETLH